MGHQGARVLVTGAEYTGGLAAVRALRADGFRPWAAVASPRADGRLSRALEGFVTVPEPGEDQVTWTQAIADTAERLGIAAVLPGTDRALLAVAEHARIFEPSVRLGVPEAEVVRRALDKDGVGRLARQVGLLVPETQIIRLDDALTPFPLTFPVMAKPVRSELTVGGTLRRFEVRRVNGPGELRSALEALPDRQALVQPCVEGPLFTVNGVAWKGEVRASVHKRATRTWPLGCGPVCRAVTVPVDRELDAGVRRLLRRIGWSGFFNVQTIESAGARYLIDFNPRLYHSLALAVAAGANLPAFYTSLLLGRSPSVDGYRSGVRFRSLDDVRATRGLVRSRSYDAAIEDLVPLGRTVCPVFSVRDRRPFLAACARELRGRAGRLSQSISKRRRRTRSAV